MKFVKYPMEIMAHKKLSVFAKHVWCGLKHHENQSTGQCNPSTRTLSNLLNLHRSTVTRGVQELEEQNLVLVNRQHRSVNNYTLLNPSGTPHVPRGTPAGQSGTYERHKDDQSGTPDVPDLVHMSDTELDIDKRRELDIYRNNSQPVEQALEIFKNYWREIMKFEYVTQPDDKKVVGIILAGLRGNFAEFELRVARYLKKPPKYGGKYQVKYGIANFHKEINRYGGIQEEKKDGSDWMDYYETVVKGD